MQEEVENRTVAFVINNSKLTGRILATAMSRYLHYRRTKHQEKRQNRNLKPMGKQTVRQLIGQNQGVVNIEINDRNIRDFDRVARKYGVDYAVRKDRSSSPPKYLVFFKARDTDALTAAFQEYSSNTLKKKDRASVQEKLRSLTMLIKGLDKQKVRSKEKGLEL